MLRSIFTFLCIAWWAPVWAHAALTITHDQPRTNLTPYISVLEDPTGLMTAAEVALQSPQKFKPVAGNRTNLGKSQSAWWFSLNVRAPQPTQGHIEIAYALLDQVQVFEVLPNSIHAHPPLGDIVSWYQRTVPNRHFWTPLNLSSGETRLLIRVQTTSTVFVPLHYSSQLASSGTHEVLNTLNGVFYGLLVAMFAYNLAMFVSLKKTSHAWFLVHIAVLVALALHLDGFLYRMLPNAVFIQHIASVVLMFAYSISALQFSRYYLNSAKTLGRLDLVLQVTLWGLVSLLLGGAFLPFELWSQASSASLLLTALLLMGVGGWAWRHNAANHGIFYFLAWTAVLSTVALAAGASLGNTYLDIAGAHIVRAGFIAQAFLMSMGLAKRIQEVREQGQAAQLKALQAQEANQAKSRFLAKVSHEVRTPLNAVLGMAELLKETPLAEQQQFYVQAIERSGSSLLTVMNDIIDYARIESGKLRLECIEFDLELLLDQLLAPLAQPMLDKKLKCYISLAPGAPQSVHGDPTRLTQVLSNLLQNAVKFTSHGSISLSVSSTTTSLVFTITDTGVGISPEAQERIFQAFDQAETCTTRHYGGSGLGLSICYELVSLMNGRIQVSSQLHQGACFTVELPLMAADLAKPTPNTHSLSRVLIFSDDALSQSAFTQTLERFAVQTYVCAEASELSAQLRRVKPHWLLISHSTPSHCISLLQDFPSLKVLVSSSANFPSNQLPNSLPIRWPCDLLSLRKQFTSTEPHSQQQVSGCIWIADDEPLNRDLLHAQLTAQGYQCRLFKSGKEMFDAYQRQPETVDLLLLDAQMPLLDGFQTSAAIREFEQRSARTATPIIMLSALSVEEAHAHLEAELINAFLTKPVDAKRLHKLLEKFLARQDTPQADIQAYNKAFAQAYYAHTPHAFRPRGFAKSD